MIRKTLSAVAVGVVLTAATVEIVAAPDDKKSKKKSGELSQIEEARFPEFRVNGDYSIKWRPDGRALRYQGSIEFTLNGVTINSQHKDAWFEIELDGDRAIRLSPHEWIVKAR